MAPLPSSTEEDHTKHYHTIRQLALITTLSAASAIYSFSGFYAKDARITSKLSGPEYVVELRNGHPETFKSAIGMQKHVFDRLLYILERKGGLADSKHMRTDEKLAIFLSMATTGMTNREAQNHFQRSADTISRTVHKIIAVLVSPAVYNAYGKFYLGDAEWHTGNQKPQNAKELFNLRHAQARNVVEHIFGVFKRQFSIANSAPEYPIQTQASLIQALCVVHNVICIINPQDLPNDIVDEDASEDLSEELGERAGAGSQAEKDQAESMWDQIAEDMWKDYVRERQQRDRRK
ncbi:hypothetical protein ACEPAF_305 [Sanghuangporus sanghuang]